jgi:hypothetical protein
MTDAYGELLNRLRSYNLPAHIFLDVEEYRAETEA